MPAASELASELVVHQIPALAERLLKYDEQNFQLQLRYEILEEEIARVRQSIAHKQSQQVRFVEQLSHTDAARARGSSKRQRTEDEQDLRPTRRPRRERSSRRSENYDLRVSDSEVSVGTKRKGRFFSNEEMWSAANF